MLKGEHSAILSTCVKLPFSIKTFVSSVFEWPLKTGFTVCWFPPHSVVYISDSPEQLVEDRVQTREATRADSMTRETMISIVRDWTMCYYRDTYISLYHCL